LSAPRRFPSDSGKIAAAQRTDVEGTWPARHPGRFIPNLVHSRIAPIVCPTPFAHAVKRLAAFLGRTPDTATAEELRTFQVHLTETGVRPPTINATVTALRIFFKVTLDQPETTRHPVFVSEPRKLPRMLSPDEVLRLLKAAPVLNTRRRSAWPMGRACGLWRWSPRRSAISIPNA
jgi:site-specific recombinase XerC